LRFVACTLLFCGVASAAEGPATRPTSAPATQPSSNPTTAPAGSLASPRDSLKWFAAALRDGDVPRLKRVVLSAGDVEDRMVGAMGDMSRALAALHTAAAKAFGAPAAEQFTDDATAHFDRVLARIDAAEITVHGDIATVRYPDDRPYELRRIGADWRIPVSQFSQGVPADALERRVAELVVQTRVVNEMSREIGGGKHRNAEAASLAWRSKMMSAVAASGPATRPAK
jgi:hypothetical protein